LTALAAFGRTYLSAGAGFIAGATGWVWFFAICALAGLPALVLLAWLQRRGHFDGLAPANMPAPAEAPAPTKDSAAASEKRRPVCKAARHEPGRSSGAHGASVTEIRHPDANLSKRLRMPATKDPQKVFL